MGDLKDANLPRKASQIASFHTGKECGTFLRLTGEMIDEDVGVNEYRAAGANVSQRHADLLPGRPGALLLKP